jgi:hypothetical protein
LIAARDDQRDLDRPDRWLLGTLGSVFAVISAFGFAHGTDFDPAGSVTDPALVMGLVTALAALMMFIVVLRPRTTVVVDLTERLARLEERQRQDARS